MKIEKFGGKINNFVLSPDGKNFAYTIKIGNKTFLVLNNQKSDKGYDDIDDITFSPNNKSVAYQVNNYSGNNFVVINNKEEKGYRFIYDLTFSPDGKHLAYIAEEDDGNRFIVIDEKEVKRYSSASDLKFSSDSKKLAFIAGYPILEENDKEAGQFVVIYDLMFNNEKVGKKYGQIYTEDSSLIFSLDSQHIAYVATGNWLEDPYFLVVDDKEGNKYPIIQGDGGDLLPSIGNISFSPDSKNITYQVSIESQLIRGSDDRIIVINGVEEKNKYDSITGPFFLDNNTIRYFINDYKINGIYKITKIVK